MPSERVSMLLDFLRTNPNDPFNYYGLAMEFMAEDSGKSLHYFTVLLEQFPEYLPSYYQAGKLLIETGQPEQAREVIEKGIELARQQGEKKTQQELTNLLVNIDVD
jgi:tetratricopeptide (TPR) repeat protein